MQKQQPMICVVDTTGTLGLISQVRAREIGNNYIRYWDYW